MTNKTFFYLSSLAIVPIVLALFYAVRLLGLVYAIEQWLPKWDTLLILLIMIIVERIYTYRYAVSQRSVLARDVISNVVNGRRDGYDCFTGLAAFSGTLFGTQGDPGFSRAIRPSLVASARDLAVCQSVSVLAAPLATFGRVSMGASFLSSPGHRFAGHEYFRLSPD